MSCDEPWYARNKIYARNGYCSKRRARGTPSGRAASRPMANCMAGKEINAGTGADPTSRASSDGGD